MMVLLNIQWLFFDFAFIITQFLESNLIFSLQVKDLDVIIWVYNWCGPFQIEGLCPTFLQFLICIIVSMQQFKIKLI